LAYPRPAPQKIRLVLAHAGDNITHRGSDHGDEKEDNSKEIQTARNRDGCFAETRFGGWPTQRKNPTRTAAYHP
jgi:hypothetical protein